MSRPLNLNILNVDEFIRLHDCKKVTSTFIYEPSSRVLKNDGLFSEDIFGQLNSPERLIKFGYIELNCTIFHPIIYSTICTLKRMYGDILARKVYARFNKDIEDFEACDELDEDADTGFAFFLKYWPKVKLVKNASVSQNDKVDLIHNSGKSAYMTKCLVMPAQIRDINPDSSRLEPDSINKLYLSLINYTNAMPIEESDSPIYDGIRFSIQKKVAEIYQYIFDMIEGKFGFFQRKYGSRALALGTRNVLSPALLNSKSPDDPTQLKIDEVGVPLFQGLKMAMPLVVYRTKQIFFGSIFNSSSDQVALIDPKTYNLVYVPITEDEKNKFISSEGVEKLVNLFRDREFRYRPLICKSDEKKYYLYLVYDMGTRIVINRSIVEIKKMLEDIHEVFDPSKLRSITYIEFFYIAGFAATKGKHAEICRYPAEKLGNVMPCKIHLMSTTPSRTVLLQLFENQDPVILPEYPVMGVKFVDSIQVHASMEPGLGADHDGDTGSLNMILSDEANEEVEKYCDSPGRWINTAGGGQIGLLYLEPMPIYNLTRDPD